MEADDYARLRAAMVEEQLIPRGIEDERVLAAMRRVPRHLFVPEGIRRFAYEDGALQIGDGQTISQPYMVAVMTELLAIKGGEKVLEVGTGSGYQAAVLAELGAEVYTIERIAELSRKAEALLSGAGYDHIHCVFGDGTLGLPEQQPFDRIRVTAGTPDVPPPLKEQLAMGGILLAPVGDMYSQQLIKLIKTPAGLTQEYHTPCAFVPLIGEFGWRST